MSKIGIMVCGNSGIDYINHEYDIPVIRSILFAGDKEYTDFVDISADEFYNMLLENPELAPSTAQAATGVILEQYEERVEKGYDELIVITISKSLSGTYEGCMLAAKMLDSAKVHVFDSKSVAYPEAKMALEAARMVQEGKGSEEILKRLEELRDDNTILLSVETLKYLVKNGRLSGAAGFVGGLLKIKPMLQVTPEGKVESIEKIRTTSKATDRMIEKFLEEVEGKDIEPFLINTTAPQRIKYIKEKVMTARPDFKEIKEYPLTPVVGAHAGPGTVAIGYVRK